jgi:hypothetical protein
MDDIPEYLRTQQIIADIKNKKIKFKDVPKEYINEEICLNNIRQYHAFEESFITERVYIEMVVKFRWYYYSCIGKLSPYHHENISEETCLKIVEKLSNSYNFPNRITDKDGFFLKAVSVNGLFLRNVYNKTEEICQAAYNNNYRAIQFIPFKYVTKEMCVEAVSKDGKFLKLIKYIFNNNVWGLITHDMYLSAVKQNGLVLKFIPENERTYEICLEAVKQNGLALRYITSVANCNTDKLYEICLEAVKQNGLALKYVQNMQELSDKEYELNMAAVKQNGLALLYRTMIFVSDKLYYEAVDNNYLAIIHVPKYKKTKELCDLAISKNYRASLFISS